MSLRTDHNVTGSRRCCHHSHCLHHKAILQECIARYDMVLVPGRRSLNNQGISQKSWFAENDTSKNAVGLFTPLSQN